MTDENKYEDTFEKLEIVFGEFPLQFLNEFLAWDKKNNPQNQRAVSRNLCEWFVEHNEEIISALKMAAALEREPSKSVIEAAYKHTHPHVPYDRDIFYNGIAKQNVGVFKVMIRQMKKEIEDECRGTKILED